MRSVTESYDMFYSDAGWLIKSFSKSFCRILMFEEKMKGKAKPTGVAPKRDLASLP